VDSKWWEERQASGLSSGEGLIFQVRDELSDKNGEIIEGIADKRLLIFEGEFAQVLRVLKREGQTRCPVLLFSERVGWRKRWPTSHQKHPAQGDWRSHLDRRSM